MRAQWNSKIGFVLATAGSAIGLGNVWRFPYLAAQNGGGAFLLIYLICTVFLGYFLLTAKLTFGHIAQTNFIDGFQKVINRKISSWWGKIGGGLTLFNIFFVSSVYVIVIGWTLSYVIAACKNLIDNTDIMIDEGLFKNLTSSYGEQLFWILLCMAAAGTILIKGVKKGIEKVSLYLMPFLFGLLLLMVGWMAFIPGSAKGFLYLLTPHWDQMGFSNQGFQWHQFAHLTLLALGQSIYSLSLGLGVCFIYGSYLKVGSNIKKSALWIVLLDTLVAILASMIVLSAVFAFDLVSNQGPTLTFITLPFVFEQMIGGKIFMLAFFILLFLGALTSLISIYEPAINLIMERLSFSRTKATLSVLGVNLGLALIVLASFTQKIQINLSGKDLFGVFDYITGTYTLGAMMLVYCIFMGWMMYPRLLRNLHNNSYIFKKYFPFVLKWLAPVVLVLLFLSA